MVSNSQDFMAPKHINKFYAYVILPNSILTTYKSSFCGSSSKYEVSMLLGAEAQRGQ